MGRKRAYYGKKGVQASSERPITQSQRQAIAALSAEDARHFTILMDRRPLTAENVRDALAMIQVGNLELELYFGPQPRIYPAAQSALNAEMFT